MNSDAQKDKPKPKNVILLEHDNRFRVFSEFVFYDFAEPFNLPAHLKGTIDRIIVDPPFLSEDCHTKSAMTVKWLCKPAQPANPADVGPSNGNEPRIIISSGERMEILINKLYRSYGVRTSDYEPEHAKGLSNEFYCYANFAPNDCWGWKTPKE